MLLALNKTNIEILHLYYYYYTSAQKDHQQFLSTKKIYLCQNSICFQS